MIVEKIKLKTIPGFPNYSITKDGRIWSSPRKNTKGEFHNGRWLKLSLSRGYYHVTLMVDSYRHTRTIHSLVLETYVGPCPKGMECRHLDGNPKNNQLKNLCWGTKSENSLDSIRHGTHPSSHQDGLNNPMSKLKEQVVRMIIYMYHTGLFTQQEIADIYKITRPCVTLIINKKRWGHLWAA